MHDRTRAFSDKCISVLNNRSNLRGVFPHSGFRSTLINFGRQQLFHLPSCILHFFCFPDCISNYKDVIWAMMLSVIRQIPVFKSLQMHKCSPSDINKWDLIK